MGDEMKNCGVFLACALSIGCGGSLDIEPVEGEWTVVSLEVEQSFTSDGMACEAGQPAAPPEALVLSDLGRKTFSLVVTLMGEEYEMDCSASNFEGQEGSGVPQDTRTDFSCASVISEDELRTSGLSTGYPVWTWGGSFETPTTGGLTAYIEEAEDKVCVYLLQIESAS
jgi:hypothetical protein